MLWPGQHPLRYYICCGLNPNTDLLIKQHWSKFLIRIISFLIHVVLGGKILIFKIQGQKLVKPVSTNFIWSKDTMISMIENQIMTDLTTSFSFVGIFLLSMLPANLVNEMDPVETSSFPNYLYIYFMHLVVPVLMADLVILLYFSRNEQLRKNTYNEFCDLIARHP